MSRSEKIAVAIAGALVLATSLILVRGPSQSSDRWMLTVLLAWAVGNATLTLILIRQARAGAKRGDKRLRAAVGDLRKRLDAGLGAVARRQEDLAGKQEDLAKRTAQLSASYEGLETKLGAGLAEASARNAEVAGAVQASRDEVLDRLREVNRDADKHLRRLRRTGSKHLQKATNRLRDLLDVELVALRSLQELERADGDWGPFANHLQRRNEMAARNIEFRNQLEASRIREIYLSEVFEGVEDIWLPLGVIPQDAGHANQAELAYVVAIAKSLDCRHIFEIGTHFGRTTYHLAAVNPECRVFTCDLPDAEGNLQEHIGSYFAGTECAERITQVACDSRELDTTPWAGTMDMILVDGDHSYELVKNDTEKAFELLKPGGVILWHDYAPKCPGVVRFAREFTEDRPLFRIRKTSVLLYIDGVDAMTFEPRPTKVPLKTWDRPDVLLP